MRYLRRLLLMAILCLGLAGAWAYHYLPSWSQQTKVLLEPTVVRLTTGMRLYDFAAELADKGLIDNPLFFRIWVKFNRQYTQFQAGQYRFEGSVSPLAIATMVEQGKTWAPFALQFVIPEGFTLHQVIERLLARQVGTRKELETLARDPTLMAAYGIKAPSLEGYLYPATYSFVDMPTARSVFEKMLQTFFSALPPEVEAGLEKKKLTLQQAVIFASLIERETQLDEERPFVADVIWNRLKAGEPLGIDAALIYGIADYKGDITWQHLRDPKNVYNNRIHKGLPPTPIGAISMESLLAVFNPAGSGYHFYVLRNDGSKRHHFTKTLEEHNAYVKELIDSSRKN